jgi:hypothetical protein
MKIVSYIAAVFNNLKLGLLLLFVKQLQNGYNMIVFENAGAPKHGAEPYSQFAIFVKIHQNFIHWSG